MSSILKPVLALAVSVLIFGGIFFLAEEELLNFIQTRFYNPSIEKSYVKENITDAEIVQNYIFELQNKFSQTLEEPAIRNSFLYNQTADDIFERSRIFGILLETTTGLLSVQFVDTNGARIHYSTSFRDIITQSPTSTSYRNYTEDSAALPYDLVSVPANDSAKFTMDEHSDRIIFSFPFFDSINVYHGTALFTVSVRALAERLISEGRLKVSDSVSVIRTPPGIVLGSPESSKTEILERVSSVWDDNFHGNSVTLDSEESGVSFFLISLKTNQGLFFGRLLNYSLFAISEPMKNIFLLSLFLTFFLTLFFILNFKPNSVTLVRSRLRRLRENLFEQLYINKSGPDRARWILELEQRRDEIHQELKRSVKLSSRSAKNIDFLIDKAWDELLAVIKSGSGTVVLDPAAAKAAGLQVQATGDSSGDAEELEEILEEVEAEEVDEVLADDLMEDLEGEAEEIEEAEEIGDADEIEEILEDEFDDLVESFKDAVNEISVIESSGIAPTSRGLLRLASKYTKPSPGLLGRASKYQGEKKASPKGLLWLASKFAQMVKPASAGKQLAGKGLLAAATKQHEKTESEPMTRKGLLALASDIEFNYEYEICEPDEEELNFEIDIVSPFQSMFSSLGSKDE